ncbi:hypothetical protein GCM10027343_40620 [Noviherbaspirillum agri]
MAQLTDEQIQFIKSQNLPLSKFFDASGLLKEERTRAMTALEIPFYYGGAICKEGHSLRAKSGHCIECDTSRIAFQLRNSASGYVYIAFSPSTRLIKVGYSKLHPQDRGAFLRNEAYGNIRDWDVKKITHIAKDAGKKEFLIHSALAKYQKTIKYEKGRGNFVECREIFDCPLNDAITVFTSIAGHSAIPSIT